MRQLLRSRASKSNILSSIDLEEKEEEENLDDPDSLQESNSSEEGQEIEKALSKRQKK